MPLSDVQARNAKPKDKPYKLADEKGLYLLVNSSGRYWRWDYRFEGKRKTMALGVYPEVPLSQARNQRDKHRAALNDGIDPGAQRKAVKRSRSGRDKFETVALEWHDKFSSGRCDLYNKNLLSSLGRDVFPWIGGKDLDDIEAADIIDIVRRIDNRGATVIAKKTKSTISQIFKFAVTTGRALRNPAADIELKYLLPKTTVKHYAALHDPKDIGALLRCIDAFGGHFVVGCALRIIPLIFVRQGTLLQAEWSEIDLDAAEWRIPAEKMKNGAKHIVPLPSQAVVILRDLHRLSGSGQFVFPGVFDRRRPMGSGTMLHALRRMGYTKDEMTIHGFRHAASTALNEMGFDERVIERALAHAEPNRVKAAYDHSKHLPERRRMLQHWADYLDGLRAGADVVQLRKSRA